MLVNKSGGYLKSTIYPNRKWVNDEGYYIIDETTEQGKQMAQTYIENYPFVEFEHDGEFVTKIIVLDKPEMPPELPGKQIVLKQDEEGNWYYDYEDRPKSQEEILEEKIMAQEQAIAELTLLLSVMMGGAE